MIKNLKISSPFIIGFFLSTLNSPNGLDDNAFYMFIIFISVIISILIRLFPMAVSVLSGLTIAILFKVISLKEALSGYGNSSTWLVTIAFLLSGIIIDSGLGKRISLLCIHFFGKTVIGIGYAICIAELILGPLVPSVTARGGGILAPIVKSISKTLGSYPEKSPEISGRYLHLVGAHANMITGAMFLTGMAANPLVSEAAKDIFNIEFDWLTWVYGSIVPGTISLVFLPILIKYLSKPEIKETKQIRNEVKEQLKSIGKWSKNEIIISFVLISMLILWISKPIHGFGTTTVALFGLVILLLSKTVSWDQMTKNHKAWDSLIWLGGLITLATSLKNTGFIEWFANNIQYLVQDFSPLLILLIVSLIYFYSMYFFSMLTAHIAAFVGSIFLIFSSSTLNPFLIVGIIGYFSNLCGCLTNYSSGPIIIYFGNGYVNTPSWFKFGFVISIYHLIIWIGFGSIWWKLIGWL